LSKQKANVIGPPDEAGRLPAEIPSGIAGNRGGKKMGENKIAVVRITLEEGVVNIDELPDDVALVVHDNDIGKTISYQKVNNTIRMIEYDFDMEGEGD